MTSGVVSAVTARFRGPHHSPVTTTAPATRAISTPSTSRRLTAQRGGGSEDTDPEREFADVAPDWLDERSFHEAAELSADLDELTTTLGWDDREQLAALVKVAEVDVDVARAMGVSDS